MQKPLILNPILTRIYDNGQRIYLKTKIRQIKPIVDSKCPESFFYMQNKLINTNKNDWNDKQINGDMNIFKKIKFNPKIKRSPAKTKFRPLFKYDHEFFSYYRKENLINVALENLQIYNRLNSKRGSYTLKNHLKDYERAQYYKKNYCKFPSIDFYRTSKAADSNLCSIFNYCTFYNYKKINERLTNEYMKKSDSQIMHKAKSSFELINSNKKKKKKLFILSPFEKRVSDEEKKCYNNIRNDIYKKSGKFKIVEKKEEKVNIDNENENVIKNKDENVKDYNEKNDKSINDKNVNKNNENNISNENVNVKNNENEFNSNDIRDNMDNNDIFSNSKDKINNEKEEISEKIIEEENNENKEKIEVKEEEEEENKEENDGKEEKEQNKESDKKFEFNYNIKENSKIKEESEIEESIDNEKDRDKIKKDINEIKKEEKKEENDIDKEELEIKPNENNKKDNKRDEEDDDDKFLDILNDEI